MKCSLTALAVLAWLLTTLSTAQAVPLSLLFGGGALTVGDKRFDQFTLNFAGTSDGRVINTSNIDVTTLGPVGPDPLNPGPGLLFSVLNNELQVTGDGVFAYADLQFGFRVSAIDPGFRIKDNSLGSGSSLNNVADGNNNLGTYIRENIGTMPGLSDLSISSVEFSVLDDILTSDITASTTFVPQSSIWVTKNILVWSQDGSDTAALNVFEQRFSQTQVVSEPGVLALLGSASLAACLVRRRQRTRKLSSP
jgi:hypothetical protein